MIRRHLQSVLGFATALVAVGLLGACGIEPESSPHLQSDDDVPFGLLDEVSGTSTTMASPTTVPVSVCLVQADGTLGSVPRNLPPGSPLADVVRALGDPPDTTEQALGLTTAISDDAVVHGVRTEAGVANVDLGAGVVEGSASNQRQAVAQIVCSLTQQPGVGQVRFQVDGESVEVARGDGSTTAEPVSRSDYSALLPT